MSFFMNSVSTMRLSCLGRRRSASKALLLHLLGAENVVGSDAGLSAVDQLAPQDALDRCA